MRLSEQAKQPITRKSFWISILVVSVLLGIMGIDYMQTGKVWQLPRLGWVILLLFVWASTAIQYFKSGRQALQRSQILYCIGYTIFAMGGILPQKGALADGLTFIGCLVILSWAYSMRRPPDMASPKAVPPAA